MNPWFGRKFDLGLSTDRFPLLFERLSGAPVRLEEFVASTPHELLTGREQEAWSIQENIGHLLDLEPLWLTRTEDLAANIEVLGDADLSNQYTDAANHDTRDIDDLLSDFRSARLLLLDSMTRTNATDAQLSALHPRLRQPMKLVDLMFFVAEHDDHHMARIRRLREYRQSEIV